MGIFSKKDNNSEKSVKTLKKFKDEIKEEIKEDLTKEGKVIKKDEEEVSESTETTAPEGVSSTTETEGKESEDKISEEVKEAPVEEVSAEEVPAEEVKEEVAKEDEESAKEKEKDLE